MINFVQLFQFQSTPSARRATQNAMQVINTAKISIHALREEGDWSTSKNDRVNHLFQSTPSARRATRSSSLSLWMM